MRRGIDKKNLPGYRRRTSTRAAHAEKEHSSASGSRTGYRGKREEK